MIHGFAHSLFHISLCFVSSRAYATNVMNEVG